MTNEYKKNLIDYLTGLLNIEQPTPLSDKILNLTGIEYSSNTWQFVIDAFSGEYSAVINGILEDEKYNKFIMYGAYISSLGTDSKGFLIYLDKDGIPYKVRKLTTRGILYLDFDSESNRVYGITCTRGVYQTGSNTSEGYFVYYNNLFITDTDDTPVNQTYSYKFYDIPNESFRVDNIVKDPDGSNYLIFTSAYAGLVRGRVYELKVNVGTSNELTTWTISVDYRIYAYWGSYSNSTPDFKLIGYDGGNSQWKLLSKNGSSIAETNISLSGSLMKPQTFYIHINEVYISNNEIYFIYPESQTDDNVHKDYRRASLIKYNGSGLEVKYQTPTVTIDGNPDGEGGYSYPIKNIPYLNIVKDIDNTMYLLEYISDEDANYTKVNLCNITANPGFNNWISNLYQASNVYRPNIFNQRALIRRNYNIANIFSFSGYFKEGLGRIANATDGFQINIQDLRPIGKYLGGAYVNPDIFVPDYVNLYSNNNLLFSRNLYNISIQNNMTMSSVEIPNNYLNNITINKNDLIGKTAYILNRSTESWTKNIYETVDLNFLNTIDIKDEDTNIDYPLGASKLNNSITNGGNTNYTNSPCLKYRINYKDGTTNIKAINWSSINNYNKTTQFTIYVDKEINSIDLISYDESTKYLNITGTFEIGNIYSIYQKVRIGEKPTQDKLQYNNEDVYYNNQPVMVYTQ